MRLHLSKSRFTDRFVGMLLVLQLLAGSAGASRTIDLAWDGNTESDIAGYRVLVGTASGNYTLEETVGTKPTTTLKGLTPGTTYFCAVQAVTTASLVSPLSSEISFTTPVDTAPEISLETTVDTPLVDGQSIVSFGNVPTKTLSAARRVTVKNLGTANLTGIAVTLVGPDAASFTMAGSLPGTGSPVISSLAPGASASFDITFQPVTVGAKSATIHVSSNDSDENPFDLLLTGTSTGAPEIAIRQASGSDLTSGAAIINFNSAEIGSGSVSETLIIQNNGSTNLTNISLTADGVHLSQFTISPLLKSSLVPGESTQIQISFLPQSAGTKSAAIHIASNDPDENPFHINLSGNGVTSPRITVSKADGTNLTGGTGILSHGSVKLGSSGTSQVITIRNSGTADLTGISITADGNHPADFLIERPVTATLSPGSSADFKVTFKPVAGGSRAAVLHIASNDVANSPVNVTVNGTGVALPEISVTLDDSVSMVDGVSTASFGTVNLGFSGATHGFTIINTGTANLTNLSLAVDGNTSDFLLGPMTATTLAPGASARFTIAFKPTTAGTRSGTIHIGSNDADENPFDIRLAGNGGALPEIAIDQSDGSNLISGSAVIDFGNASLGAAGTAKSFTIRNLGTADLTGLALSRDGVHASDFAVDGLPVSSLAPGASANVQVIFKPSAAGARTAAIHISSNDADESPYRILLSGTGADVLAVSITRADSAPLTDEDKNLGNLLIGSTGPTKTFTLKNTGTATLTGLKVAATGLNGADFLVGSPAADSLAPGMSTTFRVTFHPSSAGRRSALLHFSSNEKTGSLFDLPLTATGIAIPKIAVAAPSGLFGSESIGTTGDPQTFTISNTGTEDLENLSISIVGPHAADFEAGVLAKSVLSPGISTSFRVDFTPSAAGSRIATLRITSNDADQSLLEFDLSGSGIATPEIAIKVNGGSNLTDGDAFMSFGNVALGRSSSQKTFTITNRGSAKLSGIRLVKTGLHGSDFSVSSLRTTSLAPGASLTFSVAFKPTAGGTRWAAVQVASNDEDEKFFDIVLTGKGKTTAPQKRSTRVATRQIPTVLNSIDVVDGEKFRTLTVVWPEGQRDRSQRVEVSSDLLSWSSGPSHTTVVLSNGTTLKVRDNTPITADEKRHIRLKR